MTARYDTTAMEQRLRAAIIEQIGTDTFTSTWDPAAGWDAFLVPFRHLPPQIAPPELWLRLAAGTITILWAGPRDIIPREWTMRPGDSFTINLNIIVNVEYTEPDDDQRVDHATPAAVDADGLSFIGDRIRRRRQRESQQVTRRDEPAPYTDADDESWEWAGDAERWAPHMQVWR